MLISVNIRFPYGARPRLASLVSAARYHVKLARSARSPGESELARFARSPGKSELARYARSPGE